MLDLNADCAEFCHTQGFRHLLAVGTYQLDEGVQKRHGRLYLYQIEAHTTPCAKQKATVDCQGANADASAQPCSQCHCYISAPVTTVCCVRYL